MTNSTEAPGHIWLVKEMGAERYLWYLSEEKKGEGDVHYFREDWQDEQMEYDAQVALIKTQEIERLFAETRRLKERIEELEDELSEVTGAYYDAESLLEDCQNEHGDG